MRRRVAFEGQITVHDQPKDHRLHPTDREHAFHPLGLRCQGIGPRHVEAAQLIADATAQGLLRQAIKFLVVPEVGQGLAGRIGVQVIDQHALYRTAVAVIDQDFIDQQLAFIVRVAGMHDLRGLTDQFTDDLELPLGRRDRQVLLRPEFERQVVGVPFGIGRVVHLGRCQGEQVPSAPGLDVRATLDTAACAAGIAQRFGYDFAQRGLFSNEQSHAQLFLGNGVSQAVHARRLTP
ncbi:hypothetical protein D3C75_813600 [compost metagenome]